MYYWYCFKTNCKEDVVFRCALIVGGLIVAVSIGAIYYLVQQIWRMRMHPNLAYSVLAWWGIAVVIYVALTILIFLAKRTVWALTSEWEMKPSLLGPMMEVESTGGKV